METPKICDCGHPPTPQPAGSCGTGYGRNVAGLTHCYECCAKFERESMIETGRATLYLTGRTSAPDPTLPPLETPHWYVTDWAGHLRFGVTALRRSPRGGGFGSQRTDAWFNGPDGYVWHAVNRGDMQIARCRRTRERVQVLTATLTPVHLEVVRVRNGRPGYVWTEGYKITAPDGGELQPYMRKREALKFCKAQGWRVRVAS